MAFIADFQADQVGLCGGTLITSNVVLTAAHCVDDPDAANYRVVTGSADWSDTSKRQISGVSDIRVYPSYDPDTHYGDAAVLILSTPSSAPLVTLATASGSSLLASGTLLGIAGWGETYGGDPGLPSRLAYAPTVMQRSSYCQREATYLEDSFNAAAEICTVDPPDYGTGPCHGDSGGPLIEPTADNGAIQIGITSWGEPACDTTYPSFFTRTDLVGRWAMDTAAADPPAATSTSSAAPATLAPPPLGTLTLTEVPVELRQAVGWAMGARFRGASGYWHRCARLSQTSIRCSVAWYKGGNDYYGTVRIFLQYDETQTKVEWNWTSRFTSVNHRCNASPHWRRCPVVVYQ